MGALEKLPREPKPTSSCIESTYIQIASIAWQFKVPTIQERLVIKVSSHVVSNGDNKGGNFGKVTLIAVFRVKELELDHLATIAVRQKRKSKRLDHL